MKLYNKIGLFALALAGISSCAVNDPIADNMDLGQEVPTVSWELASTVCKAGESVSFKAKYYTSNAHAIDHAEVWAAITREESAIATVKLTPTLAYTKSVNGTDTVRSSQMISPYKHELAVWNGHEYVLDATFPVSQTLSPVSWKAPKEWSQKKFDTYYPAEFQSEFVATVIDYLTKDSTYYKDLRSVYLKYPFTAEQFKTLNAKHQKDFPTEIDAAKKSDLWYTDSLTVVAKYYITLNDKGNQIVNEVALDYVNPDVKLYNIYKSSPWLIRRYSDDTGTQITYVRPEWMAYMKDLISYIPFPEWIYNSVDNVYTVEFKRDYFLIPTIKVFDNNGKFGTDTEPKSVKLN
ncbi:MAG: hypothetical protein RSB34_05260 [Muribaculaceae bacterium]